MIYIKTERGSMVYVFPDKVKSILYNAREKKAKVCYADGENVTYIDVIDVLINAE
jgi:hypothetical protein